MLCRRFGWFPMHNTAQYGRLLIMKMLIDEFDDDPEAMTTNGRTPLHIASAFGQPEVVNFLLESNCDMNLTYKAPPPKKVRGHHRLRVAVKCYRAVCTVHASLRLLAPQQQVWD